MSDIQVRHSTAAEASRIAAFNKALAMESEGLELDEKTVAAGVTALMGHPGRGFYLVAETEGHVVGCLLVTYEWSDWRNKMFWWLQSVYVKPDYRGRGIYRALDEKAKELAAQAGNVCGIRLYVHRANTRAQEVYRSIGMERTEYQVFEELL